MFGPVLASCAANRSLFATIDAVCAVLPVICPAVYVADAYFCLRQAVICFTDRSRMARNGDALYGEGQGALFARTAAGELFSTRRLSRSNSDSNLMAGRSRTASIAESYAEQAVPSRASTLRTFFNLTKCFVGASSFEVCSHLSALVHVRLVSFLGRSSSPVSLAAWQVCVMASCC